MGSLTTMLTAYYMFRLLFTVFHSRSTQRKELHTIPTSMTTPLVILAFGSATVGFLGANEAYGGNSWINSFLALPDIPLNISHAKEYMLGGMNVLLALLGMGLAYKQFANKTNEVNEVSCFRIVVIHKFFIDEIYELLIVKPLLVLSNFIAKVMDPKIFDGFINLNVWGYRKSALLFGRLQNGKVRYYSLYILIGVSIMSCYLILTLEVV